MRLKAKFDDCFFLWSYEKVTHCSPFFTIKGPEAYALFDFIKNIIIVLFGICCGIKISSLFLINSVRL